MRMYTRRIAFGMLRLGFFASPAAIWKSIQLSQHFPNKTVSAGRTHSDDLSADERKGGLGQNRPKAKEAPLRTSNAIKLDEGTRMLPIAEPKTIVVWTSTKV